MILNKNIPSENKLKILMCGNDIALQATTKILLRTQGFEAEGKNHCEDIFAFVTIYKPNIILVEQPLSDISGETEIQFKTHPLTKGIPLIILGTRNAPDITKHFLEVYYLSKPFKPEELVDFFSNRPGVALNAR